MAMVIHQIIFTMLSDDKVKDYVESIENIE